MLRFGFIGLGQYGGRQVDAFLKLHPEYDAVAVNTAVNDLEGLQEIPVGNRFSLQGSTFGAGRTPDVAYQALLANAPDFFELVQRALKDSDFIWLCAGLGGGTGTGALQLILEYADQLFPTPPGLIMTVPRETDGIRQKANAVEALAKIQDAIERGVVGSVIILDNEKFYKQFAEDKRSGDWRDLSNEYVAKTLHELNVSTLNAGTSNFDREDFKGTLSVPGCLALGYVSLDAHNITQNNVAQKIESSLTKGFLSEGYLFTEAKVFALCFTLNEAGAEIRKTEYEANILRKMDSLFPHALDKYIAYYSGADSRILTLVGGLGFPSRVIDMPGTLQSVETASTRRFQAPVEAPASALSVFNRPKSPSGAMSATNPFLKKTTDEPKSKLTTENPFIKRG